MVSISDNESNPRVVMVGALPPPVLGMSVVNKRVYESIRSACDSIMLIDVSANSLNRSWMVRFIRFPKVIKGLIRILRCRRLRDRSLYISISGGYGKVYDILFVAVARMLRMKIYLHHHSYAYLQRARILGHIITRISGPSSIHIAQCVKMANRLREIYPAAKRVQAISNAAFYFDETTISEKERKALRTVAFFSNISEEKGVYIFLDLIEACEALQLPINAKIAGPFQDRSTEKKVLRRVGRLNTIKYVGPKYGKEKEEFFASIDLLIFPTIYKNETEGIVNYEAMRHGVPVIAYSRGCISEVIGTQAGLAIDPKTAFVEEATKKIEEWVRYPHLFRHAAGSAVERFNEARLNNRLEWDRLVRQITTDIQE